MNTSTRYGAVALERETAAVVQAAQGDRNAALNRAALALGQLTAGGVLEPELVCDRLQAAAIAGGLPELEARATIRSGLRAGAEQPRRPSSTESSSQAPQPQQPRRPPMSEVLALWRASHRLVPDADGATVAACCTFLKRRGLRPRDMGLPTLREPRRRRRRSTGRAGGRGGV